MVEVGQVLAQIDAAMVRAELHQAVAAKWRPEEDRNVTIPFFPHAFGSLDWTGKLLLLRLRRKQIGSSPSIELRKPVSRQYEEEY